MPKNTSLVCDNCRLENTFKKADLLNIFQAPRCSQCQHELLPHFNGPLAGLDAEVFIHELDRQMLASLKKIPGIDSVLRSILRHSIELSMRLHHQGNFVQASPKQLKSIFQKLSNAAHILDIHELPELYVVQDARINAYTFGVQKCSIAISSGCLELLSDEEISCVLAHELGHIKARHVLYKTASRILATLADSIAQKTLGIGGLMLYPLQIALLRWDRASELSSDRAALLVVKNPMVVLNTLMKLAGGSPSLQDELNIKAFIEQAENYEKTQEEGPLGKYIAVMNSMFNTHPFPIWRAKEIIDWVHSGEYFKVLSGQYHKVQKLQASCPHCGFQLTNDQAICPHCQTKNEAGPYIEKIDKAWDNLKSWYDKNFNLPKD